ncbi:sensor histidine kinase [Brevundimonas sp.]|uniref:sensor histidine kinase n=1 Tax=Brevundimonas sp. TaxID=1871086 RepID=UPI002489FF64|nr:sensor histidine kinase [Brevundimonas sp.]MDI1279810.1 ATP-binding protein [Brevundimonas sp.]
MTASPADPSADPVRKEPVAARTARAGRSSAAAFFNEPLAPVIAAVGVVILVVLAIEFSRSAGLVAALWGAGGLAVVVWLRNARGPMYDLCFGSLIAVGVLVGEFLAGNPTSLAIMFTAANMIEIVGAVLLARRFAPSLNLSSVEGTGRFLLSAAVLAPIPAGLFTSAFLSVLNGADFAYSFGTWWLGHAMGIAVIGAFGLAVTRRNLAMIARPMKLLETVLLLALLTAVSTAIFSRLSLPLGFVVLPILLVIAVRLRVLGLTAALLIVTILAVGGSMAGFGPYAVRFQGADRALMAQMLVLLGYLPVLLVASLLEERDRLADRARAGQARAERASEAKSRLLANVAHEVKSPVGGIIGIGELWQTGQLGPITPIQAEMAEMLVKTARQVEALSHDLLDVARAESGAVKVELRPTDVRGVMEDVRRAVALRPESRDLKLELVCLGDGLVALADSQRLAQVVANLASNAVKYGASGGSIVFRASRVDHVVRIEIIDKGPGLSADKQAQLFEPFNRLGLERTTVEGHGIGLALAKRLTELQGGTIGVISQTGEGATFWIELPAA